MTTDEAISRISTLLADGEGHRTEFKSSLRYDYAKSRVNKELTKVVVRTVAAFMNSEGGTLVIGVADDRTVLGLDTDLGTLSKKTHDGFELALRSALASYLGAEIDTQVSVDFAVISDKVVAVVSCPKHSGPVYFRDSDKREFLVRSGNLTRSLDVAATVAYVDQHWASKEMSREDLRVLLAETLEERLGRSVPGPPLVEASLPMWLRVVNRRVIDLFLSNLSKSHQWKRINIISPWISEISGPYATMNFDQFLRRLADDRTTVYLVTRPPHEAWHQRAVERLSESGRANIALVPDLHVKLFTADTAQSSFAMLGSANFTTQSLTNREIGVLVTSTGDGKVVVRNLAYEAALIYRNPRRELIRNAQLT